MYTKEQLQKYAYFEQILRTSDVSSVLDSLTGLLSRQHIVGFIQSLVESNIPFTMAVLDLDNFKFINDTYGHKTGDGVLVGVSGDLEKYLEDYALAGRYGGDEFLIVNFRDLRYDEIKTFFAGLYSDYKVLRKNICLEDYEPFITGTIGSAVFPKDAQDFPALFSLADKALYRGKTKGRNCYIIYVAEKHKNITMQTLASRSMYAIFHDLACKFDSQAVLHDKLKAMLDVLNADMRISDLYYVGGDHQFRSIGTGKSLGEVDELDRLIRDDMYTTNEIWNTEAHSRSLFELCSKNAFETLLMIRIGIQEETFGYLICAEPRTLRIWQEDECAILFFIARMLAGYFQTAGEK